MTFSCETLPTDAKAAIREMKAALREQLSDVQQVFDTLSAKIETRVAEIDALKAQGLPVWPEVSYSDIAAGTVSDATRNEIKRRGCAVIKGHFPREQAMAWDRAMLDYLDISVIYPDRIRRRPPGTTSKGLGAHTDSGALERWLLPAYQRVFANVFNGNFDDYDPWDCCTPDRCRRVHGR